MSCQVLHRKPLHAGKGEGPGDRDGTLVSSATTAFREDLSCWTSGRGSDSSQDSLSRHDPKGAIVACGSFVVWDPHNRL